MINIYLTNLGKYNEGYLVGEWVKLPVDDSELEEVKKRIGINDYYEEWFITDYETDIDGLKIGEYEDIEYLNELAEIAEKDPDILAALVYQGYTSIEDIKAHEDDVFYITTPDGFESEEYAVGYYYAIECSCLNIPDELINYFDFEAYGRDIMLEGSFYVASDGSIYETTC